MPAQRLTSKCSSLVIVPWLCTARGCAMGWQVLGSFLETSGGLPAPPPAGRPIQLGWGLAMSPRQPCPCCWWLPGAATRALEGPRGGTSSPLAPRLGASGWIQPQPPTIAKPVAPGGARHAPMGNCGAALHWGHPVAWHGPALQAPGSHPVQFLPILPLFYHYFTLVSHSCWSQFLPLGGQ